MQWFVSENFPDLNMFCCWSYAYDQYPIEFCRESHIYPYISACCHVYPHIPPAGCQCFDLIHIHGYLLSLLWARMFVTLFSWIVVSHMFSDIHMNMHVALLLMPYMYVYICIFRYCHVWLFWICMYMYA